MTRFALSLHSLLMLALPNVYVEFVVLFFSCIIAQECHVQHISFQCFYDFTSCIASWVNLEHILQFWNLSLSLSLLMLIWTLRSCCSLTSTQNDCSYACKMIVLVKRRRASRYSNSVANFIWILGFCQF